jgi:cystinosin
MFAGFAAYFISNTAFYYSPVIREQYAARHHGLTPTVAFNDITFAIHALILSIITTSQYLARPLWGFPADPGVRPSRFILGVGTGCLVGILITYCLVVSSPGTTDPASDWCALDVIYAIGYVKLLVTLIKYAPQVVANWRNKSTKGWSIWQILLDLLGGVLSVAQQGIDSYLQRDWSGITGNPVKFALGNIAFVYDTVFITQHYVVYRDAGSWRRDGPAREDDRLLSDEERRLD